MVVFTQVEDVKITVPMDKCPDDLKSNILKYLNNLREEHSAPALTEDQGISNYSQKWANDLAERNGTDSDPNNKYVKEALILGDWRVDVKGPEFYPLFNTEGFMNNYLNIFGRESYPLYEQEPTAEQIAPYDPFTRIIWKSSEKVGIGCSAGYSSPTWSTVNIVLNFYPAGNVPGSFKDNVLKKK